MRSKGFTLIELLVVIAIIGVLSTIIFNSIGQSRGRARFSATYSQLNQIAKAAYSHYLETQSWAPDGVPGSSPAFVPVYLPTWPLPPCAGWSYDWENWGATIRITVRDSFVGYTSVNSIYYYCLDSNVSTCDTGGPGGGVDIKTVADKYMSC